ncbi:MAG: hypothetical protein U1C53_02205 [Candidatus Veblenbacteria bacterium]|nr:hypothetical protein [Candidatus Veblenbacteria bacterium]MDZ4229929.1 hypothetical protein [Candidatus Veblenbacteria bacterium]
MPSTPITFGGREALTFGWQQTTANLKYFIGLVLVAAVVFILPSYLGQVLQERSLGLSVLVFLAAWVLQLSVGLGLIGIALKFCSGVKPPLSELFNYFHRLLPYLGASVLYGLIILAGLVLLVVPAFVWGVKFSLFPYFMIDRGAGVIESLHLSGQATRGVKWQLFCFVILLALINLAGALVVGLGLLVTVPVTYLALAWVYRRLASQLPVSGAGASLTPLKLG